MPFIHSVEEREVEKTRPQISSGSYTFIFHSTSQSDHPSHRLGLLDDSFSSRRMEIDGVDRTVCTVAHLASAGHFIGCSASGSPSSS
jgi:hypothetical protein